MSGFSIKHQEFTDDKTATFQIRGDEPLTWRILINLLRDLADQLEEDHENDGEECYDS